MSNVPTSAADTPFSCTIMTAAPNAGHATKELIAHPVSGRPMKNQARDLGIWRGEVHHVQLAGLAGLGALLPTLTKRQALIHGIPRGTTPDTMLPLVKEDKLGQKGTPTNAIARTLQYFSYTDPHVVMFDIDPDPYQRTDLQNAQDLMAKLASIWPVFADIGYLSTCSTSSCIYGMATGDELIPPHGLHVYLLVQGDVQRFAHLAKVQLWRADTGYCRLAAPNSRTGVAAILERCLTDLSVWSCERLDYVSGCDIAKDLPFEQRRPLPALHDGTVLDLDLLPDVTTEEEAEYLERLAAEKARVAPDRVATCHAHIKATAPDLPDDAISEEVTRRIALANQDWLAPDHVIDLSRGGTLLAGEITRKHHGLACADPMEPSYGPNHAKIFWDKNKSRWVICSLAHGFKHLFFPEPEAPTPPAADDDGSFDALIAEAEEHGRPSGQDPQIPLSDYTNAVAFVQDHQQDVRYIEAWDKWLHWAGAYWRYDVQGPIMQRAKQTIRRLLRDAANGPEAALLVWMKHIKASLSKGSLSAMIALAQDEPGIPVAIAALNTRPWLLPCTNGTVDLTTGTLRASCRDDLLTECLPLAYDQNADCPHWKAFLLDIMGRVTCSADADPLQGAELTAHQETNDRAIRLCAFLQRVLGQCLTGDVSEQDLYIFYGTGANGKSTLLNTVMALLGTYAMKGTAELLMTTRNDRHPTERADLFGKRLVCTIETQEAGRLNETFIKEATGGDPIRARRMREDFWEFLPTHTMVLATNHKPEIRGTDHAIWRRIKLIPFTITIPDAKQDKELPAKLLKELPGILAWMVQGCLDWKKNGLHPPKEVTTATDAYKQEQDVFDNFLVTECFRTPTARVSAADIYDAYTLWCKDNDIEPIGKRAFGIRLAESGCTPAQGTGGRREWVGVGLPTKRQEDARYEKRGA